MFRVNSIVAAVAAVSASVVLMGCSDTQPVKAPPPQKTEVKAQSVKTTGIAEFRASLIESEQQIDATLASLANLNDPGQTDLTGAYNNYCDQLARMKEMSATLKTEADAMRASRDAYFSKWDEKVSEIDNPTIRQSAEARRKRLRDAHEQIITTSSEAKDAYVPFMKDLEDVRKYLANDLSKSSLADINDAVKSVQSNGVIVKNKIDAIVRTLTKVESGN